MLLQIDHISKAFGDKQVLAKAVGLLRDEVLRYAQNVRFYQSLSTGPYGLYNRLTKQDLYADQVYFPELLSYYSELDPDGIEALLNEVASMGVNLNRVFPDAKTQ